MASPATAGMTLPLSTAGITSIAVPSVGAVPFAPPIVRVSPETVKLQVEAVPALVTLGICFAVPAFATATAAPAVVFGTLIAVVGVALEAVLEVKLYLSISTLVAEALLTTVESSALTTVSVVCFPVNQVTAATVP